MSFVSFVILFIQPLPGSQHASLQATWGFGNQMFVYAANKTPPKDTGKNSKAVECGRYTCRICLE